MHKGQQIRVGKTELAVTGRFFRTARLRHEWFEFLENPPAMVKRIQQGPPVADVFTFLQEVQNGHSDYQFHKEMDGAAVLKVTTREEWWKNLDFKVRNKARKAQKSGVELRPAELTDDFVRGVESIYNESPLRQRKKFWHYGKGFAQIKEDLSSFPDCTFFIGAYHRDELIGFVKLFQGNDILRTVHIIAKLSHRDKPVQDALIAKAVAACEERKISRLHYGDWSRGGLGAFKIKHGFERVDFARYFVPLTAWGKLLLQLNLHHPIEDRLPERWIRNLTALRAKWNSLRYGAA